VLIFRAFRFASYAFALTIVLSGLVSSAGQALGGSETDHLTALALVLLGLAAGLLRPGPHAAVHLVAALTLGVAAWILPELPRAVAALFVLGSLLPLSIVGRRFGHALAGTSPGSPLLALGVFFGLVAANFGTGPWLYLLMVVGILWPPPANAVQNRSAQPASRHDRIALFAVAFCCGVMLLSLRPFAALFDSGNVLQDTRRAVTLMLSFGVGWWALGAAFADGKVTRWLGASIALAASAVGLQRSGLTVDRLATPEEFAPLIGGERLLGMLNRTARLTEVDDLYVPLLTLVLLAFPTIAICSALRAVAGSEGQTERWPVRLGLICSGFAAAILLTASFALPLFGESILLVAFYLCLTVAVFVACGAGLRVGLPSGIAAAAIAFSMGQPGDYPNTGYPYYSLYQYSVAQNQSGTRAQQPSSSSVLRVIERQTPDREDSFQLHDGHNRLSPNEGEGLAWQVDTVFAACHAASLKRCLMVGTPHAESLIALRANGAESVDLAIDPPELAKLAWGFTPAWSGEAYDGMSSTVARARGDFDFIMIREIALWESRRNRSLRPAALKQAARKLNETGSIAIWLDPRRSVPGLTDALRAELSDAVGVEAEVYIVPHQVFSPSVLIVASRDKASPAIRTRCLSWLRQHGLAVNPTVDFEVMRGDTTRDSSDLFPRLLSGPLPHFSLALASTAPSRLEEARPWQASARVLGRLGETGSLPWVLAAHEGAQVWSLKDTQVAPREAKVDLSADALQGLVELARRYPESLVLKQLAENFAVAAVRKREVEWAYLITSKLVDEIGWRTPWLLVSYGETLFEMLDKEGAERLANEALTLDPEFEPAIRLGKIARGEIDPLLETRAGHEGHAHR